MELGSALSRDSGSSPESCATSVCGTFSAPAAAHHGGVGGKSPPAHHHGSDALKADCCFDHVGEPRSVRFWRRAAFPIPATGSVAPAPVFQWSELAVLRSNKISSMKGRAIKYWRYRAATIASAISSVIPPRGPTTIRILRPPSSQPHKNARGRCHPSRIHCRKPSRR